MRCGCRAPRSMGWLDGSTADQWWRSAAAELPIKSFWGCGSGLCMLTKRPTFEGAMYNPCRDQISRDLLTSKSSGLIVVPICRPLCLVTRALFFRVGRVWSSSVVRACALSSHACLVPDPDANSVCDSWTQFAMVAAFAACWFIVGCAPEHPWPCHCDVRHLS